MQKKKLRKKESKEISKSVQETAGVLVEGEMEVIDFGDLRIVLVNREPLLMEFEGRYYVSVYGAIKLRPEKFKVVVDSGAMEPIMNGADVMKPGIVSFDPRIRENDFVYVTVGPKDVPIAVGIALCSADEMRGKGKAVKNLHHVKDRIWRDLVERKLVL